MDIVIAGGGDIGVKIAQKLIYEGHNVTIIEKDETLIRLLKRTLDAMIVQGDTTNTEILIKSGIKNCGLFVAVTNDKENLIACALARKCGKPELSIAAKIDDYSQFFGTYHAAPEDFGINMVIKPMELTVKKIIELIMNPDIFEVASYANDLAQMVGVKVGKEFRYSSMPIAEMALKDSMFTRVRIVAIQRGGEIIIPSGSNKIYPNDKLYFVGKTELVKKLVRNHFSLGIKQLDNIIIIGGSKQAVELSRMLEKLKKTVTIIEEDRSRCEDISAYLENVLVINGSATDSFLMEDLRIDRSCVVNISDDDEYNILGAFTSKKYGASKTICMIKNSSTVNVMNNLASIDAVFSPHALTVGETLKLTRKDDLFSESPFTEIEASTIGINITEKLPILDIPLKDIKLPPKTIIGVIVRGNSVIIPTGDDVIKLGDRLVVFLLPQSIYEMERRFTKRLGGR